MIRVRFAPTPSGHLFVSSARVALANFLHARRHGGQMLLRLDDLDAERTKPIYAESMMQDLRWLGIAWDESIRQSQRMPLYAKAIERLKQSGRLYPCFESEEELRAKQDYRRKRGQPTIYDRAMLQLTPEQRAAAEAGGKVPYWRFRLSARILEWPDLIMGKRQAKLPSVSDPVLVLADGRPAPLLASVVDDIDTGITHIIRADDNAANTGIQIELFEVLGANASRLTFAHLPQMTDASRDGGSAGTRGKAGRRVGSLSLRSLRGDGIEATALVTYLAAGGGAGDRDAEPALELAPVFSLARLGKASGGFDPIALMAMNRQALRRMAFASVVDRLPNGATEAFWLSIRGSLDLLTEARGWWDVVTGTIVPPVMEKERDFLTTAETLLPPEPWNGAVWQTWIDALAQATGRDLNAVVEPLRLALTGEDHGPDLTDLLPLIGRNRTANRLRIAVS